jgi:hypothetical protein
MTTAPALPPHEHDVVQVLVVEQVRHVVDPGVRPIGGQQVRAVAAVVEAGGVGRVAGVTQRRRDRASTSRPCSRRGRGRRWP